MADSDLRNIFGLTITIAYIKASSRSSKIAKLMCEAVAEGFSLSTSDGDTIFAYFNSEGAPTTNAFSEAPYTTYEQEVRDIFDAFLTSADNTQKELITAVAHAMIFAYSLNSANNLNDFLRLMGTVLSYVAAKVLNATLFSVRNNVVVIPFSTDTLRTLLENDYSDTLASLKLDSRSVEARLTNYNWYDVSDILQGPNLTLMKDVENQYYYVSGVMLYQSSLGTVDPCIEDTVTITSWSGSSTFSYVRNVPCREVDSYIGPVNSLQFKRIFNDGPASSGYFDDDIIAFYTGNDTAMLAKQEYLTNSYSLQAYTGGNLATTFVDANGRYSIGPAEYLYIPRTNDCEAAYQRMHIGDNHHRTICDAKFCKCSTYDHVTGFKFAALDFPNTTWAATLQFRQTNPLSDFTGLLRRAWSITENPYVAEPDGEGMLWPYFKDVEENQYWYVGYPILNGVSSLPQLAFLQTFESPSFGNIASIAIYPSIGTSDGGATEGGDSTRTYEFGDLQLFSGAGALPIQFSQKISSNLSGKNLTTQKFFGMGDAFSGKYKVNVSVEENAGFFYTGFSVMLDGKAVNANTLADSYDGCVIGKYPTMTYISGYRRTLDGTTYPLSNKFAKNVSGDIFTYSYIAQSDVPPEIIEETNWAYFSQVPTNLEKAPYERVYSTQTVENYFPRFHNGPFSVETRKFLYPNATAADRAFQGKLYGIPTGITFKLKIREEAVKEVYGEYTIYTDGTVDSTPKPINVIRTDIKGTRTQNPTMRQMFIPDKAVDRFDYDFGYWNKSHEFDYNSLLYGLVDNDWAPKIAKEHVPIGRNSNEYKDALLTADTFRLGLKRIYVDELQSHITYGPDDSEVITYSRNPMYEGLYHAFTYNELTGSLAYSLPIFDLSKNAIVVNDGIKQAFPIQKDLLDSGILIYRYAGYEFTGNTGQDPMFFEYVGGRRGGITAAQEGGYHPYGIIGDQWLGMAYQGYGVARVYCNIGYSSPDWATIRYPAFDKNVLVFSSALSGTNIFAHGLSFSPFVKSRDTRPLTTSMKYYYNIDNQTQQELVVSQSGEFMNFNLGQFFTTKTRTLPASENEWYYGTGVQLGPFDRDVEIGLSRGEYIGAYSDLFINGQRVSHWFRYASDCERDWAINIGIDRIVQCGQPFYVAGRNQNYTILAIIPSGQKATFNILSAPSEPVTIYDITTSEGLWNWHHDPAYSRIGMPTGAIVSLRTHVPLDTTTYQASLDSGEANRLSSNIYVENGLFSKYSIEHHQGLGGLAGKFVFVHTGEEKKLYPKPNEVEFAKLASKDSYGNLTYPSSATVENYWRRYAMQNQQRVKFSGVREGSRIMFEIYDVQLKFDVIPYQSYGLVVPSGDCILSGEMGYYAQADNSIFTEGFRLVNGTPNDVLASFYDPSYVSAVLSRLPAALFKYPSTVSGHAPVLSAPSVMKQRENPSGITENQNYVYLYRASPYNYNKLLWPALSDLETLNPGETMESLPPGDGNTFTDSTVMFSASQGQALPNGLTNPTVSKRYYVQDIFQLYDSVATDALKNTGTCVTSGRGTRVYLAQNELSGALVPIGTPLGLIVGGLV